MNQRWWAENSSSVNVVAELVGTACSNANKWARLRPSQTVSLLIGFALSFGPIWEASDLILRRNLPGKRKKEKNGDKFSESWEICAQMKMYDWPAFWQWCNHGKNFLVSIMKLPGIKKHKDFRDFQTVKNYWLYSSQHFPLLSYICCHMCTYCICVYLYNQFSSFYVVPQLSSCN